MKASLLFSVVLFFTFPMWGQKSLRALKQVYTKKELKTFEEQYGNLDLLVFAYDHAISIVSNIGSKNTDIYPLAVKTNHFTDLNVQILPYTQYFRTETPGELLAVKSMYQLQLAYKGSNK
ncbi:MAG: hypothetical protein RL432_571 [Bacteroidota bacterium]|jgi:hypothetical protein